MRGFREFLEDAEKAIAFRDLLDSGSLVFFFRKDGKVYAAPEESRICFARMRHPDEDNDKELSFMAFELNDDDEPRQRIFEKKDLRGMKIIDQSEAIKKGRKRRSSQ